MILKTIISAISLLSLPLLTVTHTWSGEYPVTVAITQIVEHPALDLERQGITEALREAGYIEGQNLKLIYQNAQGSTVTSAQIAQKLVSLNPDVLVAISTPSAQAALAAIGRKKLPLVFSAVTDPAKARLIKDLNHPGIGVSGVTDLISPKPQLELIRKWIPNIKRLGVIYNPGEANSEIQIQELRPLAAAQGIQVIPATANRTGEVPAAAQSLVGRVDAIYIPNDNTAVSAIEGIVRVGIQHHLPVFAGDQGSVQRGAAAAAAYNRILLGKSAGQKVIQFLKGGYAQEISISDHHPVETIVNESSAEKMGLNISKGKAK